MADIIYRFKPEEIVQHMNYVGEAFKLGSQPAKTGRGKRLYNQMIPVEYQDDAQKMIERCRKVHSVGLKGDVNLTSNDCIVLHMLCDYVSALYYDV